MYIDIPDHPVIACIERTGYPPWMQEYQEEDDWEDEYFEEE